MSASHLPNWVPTANRNMDVPNQPNQDLHQNNNSVSSLARTRGTFSNFLAPLTLETFKNNVLADVEQKLRIVNQTLSSLMLDTQGLETILQEMLQAITLKTRELMGADRTTIFLLDEEKQELWSIVAEGEGGRSLEIRIPANQGIAGEAATSKKPINIPYDFYDDERSGLAKQQDIKNGYRTYTVLALPLTNEAGDLVAVVQLLNKLKFPNNLAASLADRIDINGFSEYDQELFEQFAPLIRLILESSRSFYVATQRQRAAAALMKAIKSLSESSLDLEDTLKRVMNEAQELMNADRSTLWLLDQERGDLWTKIPQEDGSMKEMRLQLGQGFAGKVAETHKKLNIPFDLYEHPDSETSKALDRSNGYRTCSLLCMPVFNADKQLIGVTQLLNKKKVGEFPPYNPHDWPKAPECFQASFDRNDEEFMEAFNIQAGIALQNAKLFATVKQQEKQQRDMLRSLSDGVLSTDKSGYIIAVNESAKRLLGVDECDLEGQLISDVVKIKEGNFDNWCKAALRAEDWKCRQQYYPDRTLISPNGTEHSINLSVNTISDASDNQQVRGALVVMEDISDEKRLKSTMYRYMTQELAEELLKLDDEKLRKGDKKQVSILFSDIRGYTTLTENLAAEEVVSMLNEYFESMVDAVFTHKGTLDKYIGDAIMAVFGSPLPLEEHALMAVQTALEMRDRLVDFNLRRQAENKPIINIGIGINSDTVISGNIGSSKRMEFTAIGDGVNLGSRLESVTKLYGCDIIISDNTYQKCRDRVVARELDFIRVKGKNEPVAIYELVGLTSDSIPEYKQRVIEHYHRGRQHYLQRQFKLARGEFAQVLDYDRHDQAATMHLSRCQHWLINPPTEFDWEDGVWTLKEK